MFYVVWTGKVVRGKSGQGKAFFKESNEYLRTHYKDKFISTELVANITGDRPTLHWVVKCKSLDDWHSMNLWEDEGWVAIAKKYSSDGEAFVSSSVQMHEIIDPAQ